MPISQQRMMAVISAGINFKDAYEALLNRMRVANTKIRDAADAETKQLEWDLLFYGTGPFTTEVQDATILMVQHEHFRRNKRGNELRAGYQRRKREADLRAKIPEDQVKLPTPSKPMTTQEAADDAELAALWNSIKTKPE